MAYRTVIVGTDGSASAEAAVRAAADLAGGEGAELVVVTAFGTPVGEPVTPVVERGEAEEIARRGGELARTAGAERVAVRSGLGAPADVLLAIATEVEADLVVVGSRGMTRPLPTTLGAVANTVTHHAACDVLVFRSDV